MCFWIYMRYFKRKDTVYHHPEHPSVQTSDSRFGARHVQCLMAFLGLGMAYCMRVNLSVAIVSMTQKSTGTDFPVLPWDESMKGTILSSFFWGYLLLQVPAGQLAEKFGPKFLLAGTVFFSGFVTVLTPYAAIHGGFYWMVATRILQGAVQGFLLPCANVLVAKWTPAPERGRIFTWVFNGTKFGILVTMPVAGYLADSPWGWPSIFYVSGGAAILWSILYCYIGANSPQEHPTISESERKYILSSMPSSSPQQKMLKTPWKAILTSIPMWAIAVAHTSLAWGYWTLLTQIPSYVNSVMGINLKKSGLLSALPYLTSFVMAFVFSAICDWMINKEILSRSASKKIWSCVAMWGPALALCILAFSGKHAILALSMLIAAVAPNSAIFLGFLSNHIDLSPNFAGTLMGITNGLSNIGSVAAPLFAGYIVTDTTSLIQWQIVFLTSAAIFFFGNLIFIIFGTVKIQPWNFAPEEQTPKVTPAVE